LFIVHLVSFCGRFSLHRFSRDGALSGAEIVRGPLLYVRPPDLTYTDRIKY